MLNETPQPRNKKLRNLPSMVGQNVYKSQLDEYRAPHFGGDSLASVTDQHDRKLEKMQSSMPVHLNTKQSYDPMMPLVVGTIPNSSSSKLMKKNGLKVTQRVNRNAALFV